jgi:hypothetical protein
VNGEMGTSSVIRSVPNNDPTTPEQLLTAARHINWLRGLEPGSARCFPPLDRPDSFESWILHPPLERLDGAKVGLAAAAGTTGFKVPAVRDVLWFCQGCVQVSPGKREEGQAVQCGLGCT